MTMTNAFEELSRDEISSGLHPVFHTQADEAHDDDDGEVCVDESVDTDPRLSIPPPRPAIRESMLPKSMHGVIGTSETLLEVFRIVDRVADTTCNILITGESGTGKEIVARAVHRASPRGDAPFVAVN